MLQPSQPLCLAHFTSKPQSLIRFSVGLVIEEARYGPAGHGEEQARQLDIDVTIPLQALVHNSQLYIPGGRSKVSSRPALFLYCPSIATCIVIPVAEATLVGLIHGARDVPCRAQLKRHYTLMGRVIVSIELSNSSSMLHHRGRGLQGPKPPSASIWPRWSGPQPKLVQLSVG